MKVLLNPGESQDANSVTSLIARMVQSSSHYFYGALGRFEYSGTQVDPSTGAPIEDGIVRNDLESGIQQVFSDSRLTTVDWISTTMGEEIRVGLIGRFNVGGWYASLSTTIHTLPVPPETFVGNLAIQYSPIGYDGYVDIPPGRAFVSQNGQGLEVPRHMFVFHELQEVFLRTNFAMSYHDAHSQSILLGSHMWSGFPHGEVGAFAPSSWEGILPQSRNDANRPEQPITPTPTPTTPVPSRTQPAIPEPEGSRTMDRGGV
jgi:hypothetical protein